MLSIVIPTAKEKVSTLLLKSLEPFHDHPHIEIIYISFDISPLRSERINAGVLQAKGSMILLHHPRSYLEPEGIKFLITYQDQISWGGFTHRFDWQHPLLRFTSWYSNEVRSRIKGIIYLDHCIFFHRSLWQTTIPAVALFEDTLLSEQLRQLKKPLILPYVSTTSAIRFQTNGIYYQAILNQCMKIGFFLKLSNAWLNTLYERGLNLNNLDNSRR
jgi:hypothetical protein